MEKEQRIVELAKRKQMTKSLPKLFDRIYFLYQNPKSSAIRKGALIRYLTECHLDITDESRHKFQFPNCVIRRLNEEQFYQKRKEIKWVQGLDQVNLRNCPLLLGCWRTVLHLASLLSKWGDTDTISINR